MINYLNGILVSKTMNSPQGCYIVVDVAGIGYQVVTNRRVVSALGSIDEPVKIFTSLIHREDSMILCGFLDHEDRDLFNILQSVSGIGVKVAMLLLENMTYHELVEALVSGDAKKISKTKGIGPKLAQRIVLELKDKMTNFKAQIDDTVDIKIDTDRLVDSSAIEEAQSILLSLGYSSEEIKAGLQNAIAKANEPDNFEELIKLALQTMAEA